MSPHPPLINGIPQLHPPPCCERTEFKKLNPPAGGPVLGIVLSAAYEFTGIVDAGGAFKPHAPPLPVYAKCEFGKKGTLFAGYAKYTSPLPPPLRTVLEHPFIL
jgi:hypothetical protein